jgi:hypothetical protein
MHTRTIKQLLSAAVMAATLASATAQEHPAIKHAIDLPPPADLSYAIEARQKGITLSGQAHLKWRVSPNSYSIANETRASLLGKILNNRSEGSIDAFGLAPVLFTEKRFRKDPTSVRFERGEKVLSFSSGPKRYRLVGGEQDRGSVQWQLVAAARGAPDKFVPGSQWKFFVAGRKDAEAWTFTVIKRETIRTGMGSMQTVHLSRTPPPDKKDQQLDIWLAPQHEWYPVKLRFTEDDDEFIEQTIESIAKM